MFDAGWLNLGSLLFGLLAWILPIVSLLQHNLYGGRRWVVLSVASLSACAIALCMQIFYSAHLVRIKDWSALMDLSQAVALVSAFLLGTTILLNAITLVMCYRKGWQVSPCQISHDMGGAKK